MGLLKKMSIWLQPKKKRYDLEARTFAFARADALLRKSLVKSESDAGVMGQVIRASSSVGPDYVEVHNSLGKRGFVMKMKTYRKEARKSAYWHRLIMETIGDEHWKGASTLIDEAIELKKIFSCIVEKST